MQKSKIKQTQTKKRLPSKNFGNLDLHIKDPKFYTSKSHFLILADYSNVLLHDSKMLENRTIKKAELLKSRKSLEFKASEV